MASRVNCIWRLTRLSNRAAAITPYIEYRCESDEAGHEEGLKEQWSITGGGGGGRSRSDGGDRRRPLSELFKQRGVLRYCGRRGGVREGAFQACSNLSFDMSALSTRGPAAEVSTQSCECSATVVAVALSGDVGPPPRAHAISRHSTGALREAVEHVAQPQLKTADCSAPGAQPSRTPRRSRITRGAPQ